MSDVTNDAGLDETVEAPLDERTVLLQRARLMGLKVSNNIGLASLKAKISAALEAKPAPVESAAEVGETPEGFSGAGAPEAPLTEAQLRAKINAEAMKLIRIRLTCMNPHKKDLPGEIFTVGNDYIGVVRKYVPFGDGTENGYHVPNCIYQHLKERKYLHIRTNSVKRDGVVVETSDVPEFAIEVLPQLTPEELKKLAIQQAVAAGQVTG